MSCREFPRLPGLILLLVSSVECGSEVSGAFLLRELQHSHLASASNFNTIKALRAKGGGGMERKKRKDMNLLIPEEAEGRNHISHSWSQHKPSWISCTSSGGAEPTLRATFWMCVSVCVCVWVCVCVCLLRITEWGLWSHSPWARRCGCSAGPGTWCPKEYSLAPRSDLQIKTKRRI